MSAPTPRTTRFAALLLFAILPALAQALPVVFSIEAPGAASVYLAGEFNGWDPSAQKMEDPDGDGVFTTTLDLDPGRYAYKFVIDGNWKEDPKAGAFVDDGFGGKNSVVEVLTDGGVAGQTPPTTSAVPMPEAASGQRLVRFVAQASPGAQVYLAGEFNGWDPQAQKMDDPDGDGRFEVVLPLEVGRRYAYKFVIDGNWKEDPKAGAFVDDGFGGKNSVVEVAAGEGVLDAGAKGHATAPPPATGGAATAAPVAEAGLRSVVFRYQPVISGVNEVFLAGTFNDWNVGATPMSDADGDGTYEATLLLAPGDYQYKFVVDGSWITDEQAEDFADDGFGGRNSVIHVDARYATIDVAVGDGKFYLEGLDLDVDYATVNEVRPGETIFRTRAYLNDVQAVELLLRPAGEETQRLPMRLVQKDNVFAVYQTTTTISGAEGCRFTFVYRDGDAARYALADGGFAEEEPPVTAWAVYDYDTLAPFRIPEWAQRAVYYQIFPDRFRNGDPSNDQDFHEPYYAGRNQLPPRGKTNGEYFHLVEDWDDISGLQRSPYRTDGKPDYYSFYGGDIAGVMQKLDYLADLGVTIIYFNPVTDARSNHRYDPCDYLKLDPHLGSEDEFRAFTTAAKERGIRVIVDMAYNHTGDCHFAFQDIVRNGRKSRYWNWYEFKKELPSWPLPPGENAIDYYDCWWGFGLHPNLNYDLSRPNAQENGITDIEQAEPNMEVVNYVLDSVDYWLGELGVSGFRLDVPNEVPFWFWRLFRERCRQVAPEHVLIGEIWGDAGAWIGPDVFDAVMNYKYFKDPVVKWIGQHQGSAEVFDRELAPGRTRYPLQAARAQMNLVDSHDTVRFLQVAGGDARRLRLAATFSMTYLGAPHVYYGDEVALDGGKDPDCRRTFPWSQLELPARRTTLEHYRALGQLRRRHDALALGDFRTVKAQGDLYAYLREHGDDRILVVLNDGDRPIEAVLPIGNFGVADTTPVTVLLGEDPGGLRVFRGALKIQVGPVSGLVLWLGTDTGPR